LRTQKKEVQHVNAPNSGKAGKVSHSHNRANCKPKERSPICSGVSFLFGHMRLYEYMQIIVSC
jgi:hypothetical protein